MRNAHAIRLALSVVGERLSYANVMSTVAVFVALGGSAWAVAVNSVGTRQLKNGAVSAKKIKKNAVRTRHIRNGAVTAAKLAGGVGGAKGDQGLQGLQGLQGAKGDQGLQGLQGAKGDQGLQGLQGAKGDPCPASDLLCRGPKGDTGATGPQGAKGDTGATGAKGDQGLQGLQGLRGDKGDSAWSAACNEGLDPGDAMVRVGSVCVDRYEASIWTARTGGTQITGAIPCSANGQDCTNIYARSVAGVAPRGSITWFQAAQALANSGKRLPSNAEWQTAVAGTPDSTACNVSTGSVQSTGANAGCISNHGANDMVGNLYEWVADWVPRSSCGGDWGAFSDDLQCLAGAAATGPPGALVRGGAFFNGTNAGPFAVYGGGEPSGSFASFGFRGAR